MMTVKKTNNTNKKREIDVVKNEKLRLRQKRYRYIILLQALCPIKCTYSLPPS